MKLIIQIPCFNEAKTLRIALDALPRQIPGVDTIETLIINDGSTDETVDVARAWGVNHVISHPRNMGLAKAFMTGLHACLERGADVIVNTDADNQYNADDMGLLVRPIINGDADLVIGTRPIASIEHFSPVKKTLQKLGSWVVRTVSGVPVKDAPSGFRAISRSAAMSLNVFNKYTYTLETIIQAGQSGLRVVDSPVRVNEDLRPSRLVKSIRSYIQRSIITIIRIFVAYRPLPFFLTIGLLFALAGTVIGVRFLVFYLTGSGGGHVQSLILAAALLLTGIQTVSLGVLGDIISVNRMLLEDIQSELRRNRFGRRNTHG